MKCQLPFSSTSSTQQPQTLPSTTGAKPASVDASAFLTLRFPSKSSLKVYHNQIQRVIIPQMVPSSSSSGHITTSTVMIPHSDSVVSYLFNEILLPNGSTRSNFTIPSDLLVEMTHLCHDWKLDSQIASHCEEKLCDLVNEMNSDYLDELARMVEAKKLREVCGKARKGRDRTTVNAANAQSGKNIEKDGRQNSVGHHSALKRSPLTLSISNGPSSALHNSATRSGNSSALPRHITTTNGKYVRINDGPPSALLASPQPKKPLKQTKKGGKMQQKSNVGRFSKGSLLKPSDHSHLLSPHSATISSARSDILERMPFGDETPASATSRYSEALTPFTHMTQKHWTTAHTPKLVEDANGVTMVQSHSHTVAHNPTSASLTTAITEDALELDQNEIEANLEQQDDEIIALESIYGMEEVEVDSHTNSPTTMSKFQRVESNICILNVQVDSEHVLSCEFLLPQDYPSHSAPTITMKANWIDKKILHELTRIQEDLEDMFSRGSVVLFEWSEKLLATETFSHVKHLLDLSTHKAIVGGAAKKSTKKPTKKSTGYMQRLHQESSFQSIHKSESPTTVKSSKFVAHACTGIHSGEQIKKFLEILKTNNKIASATHNIAAYRFHEGGPSGVLHENRDDDGEGGAGDVLLKLMQQMDVRDVLVVVTRWYGGTPLGSRRFKIISNCAHEVLGECQKWQQQKHGRKQQDDE